MTEQLVIDRPQEQQDQPQPEPHPEPQPAPVGAQLEPKPAPAPVVEKVSEIVQQLKQERERAQKEVQTFDAAITALGSNGSNAQPPQPKPQLVPAAAQPARTKPQPAPVAGQPPQQNQQPAPAAAKPPRSNPQSAPAVAQPVQGEPKPAVAPVVENVSEVVEQLKQERDRAQKEVKTFDAAIAALGSNGSNAQPLQPKPQPVPAAAQPTQTQPKPAPADAKPPRSMARRIIVRLVVVLILAAVGFGVWRVFFYVPPLPANIVPLSGRIEGDDSAVSPKTSGRILEIRVREGDRVSTGDIIAVLDDAQLRARIEQAQAEVQQAQAKARSARDQIAVLNEQLRQEEANVAQQEAAQDIASFDKEAYTRLARSGAVAERQGKQAVSTADQQAAAVAGAKRRVAGVNMQLAQQQATIADAMASVGHTQAQLTEAMENRQDLTVKAPFDGTVVTRVAEPGEVITSGTPVITLLDLSKVYLRGFVPEGQIGKVKVGQAAHVYLDSNPKQPVDAYVSRIDPQATFTPENTYFRDDRVKQVVGLKLQLKGALGYAKPGMPADGEVLVAGDQWPEEKRK
jgi:HlyD family secretion protein